MIGEKPTTTARLVGSIGDDCHHGSLTNLVELLSDGSARLLGQIRAFTRNVRFHILAMLGSLGFQGWQ